MYRRFSCILLFGLSILCCSCTNTTIGTVGAVDLNAAYPAAESGDYTAVMSALENGLKVDQPDKEGKTLLHYAVLGDQQKLAIRLIEEYKANVNIKDKDGNSPLAYAKQYQNDVLYSVLQTAGATE